MNLIEWQMAMRSKDDKFNYFSYTNRINATVPSLRTERLKVELEAIKRNPKMDRPHSIVKFPVKRWER